MGAHLQVPYQYEAINNVTASRSLETVYTNNTGKNLQVSIVIEHSVGYVGGGSLAAFYTSSMEFRLGFLDAATANYILYTNITVGVLPGKTYYLHDFAVPGGVVIIKKWIEQS